MKKYRLPNLRGHLVDSGLTITKFRQKAHAVVGDDDVSARTWASVINDEGAGETSVNSIIDVARRTFESMGRPCPESALEKTEVAQKPGQSK